MAIRYYVPYSIDGRIIALVIIKKGRYLGEPNRNIRWETNLSFLLLAPIAIIPGVRCFVWCALSSPLLAFPFLIWHGISSFYHRPDYYFSFKAILYASLDVYISLDVIMQLIFLDFFRVRFNWGTISCKPSKAKLNFVRVVDSSLLRIANGSPTMKCFCKKFKFFGNKKMKRVQQ